MSLYNATVGTATKLVISSGNMLDDVFSTGGEFTNAGLKQAKRVNLSASISLALDEENEASNREARRQDALWTLAERNEAHKARMAKNPAVLAEYNRLAGITS